MIHNWNKLVSHTTRTIPYTINIKLYPTQQELHDTQLKVIVSHTTRITWYTIKINLYPTQQELHDTQLK